MSAFIDDGHVGILYFGRHVAVLHVLHQLSGNLHLHAYLELAHAFGKVSPVSFENSAAILRVGHPESLLVLADIADDFRDVTRDGIGFRRGSVVGKGAGQLNGLCASDLRAFFHRSRTAAIIFKNSHYGILHLGNNAALIVDKLHQLACYLHLCTSRESRHSLGKVSPIGFEHSAASLCVGHPESLLVSADVAYNLRDVTRDGVSISRSGAVGQCFCQIDSLCAGNGNTFVGC